MKNTYICLLASLFGLLSACSKEEETKPTTNTNADLVATINGQQQVPANASTATGSFVGAYTSSNRQLVYTVTFQGIMPNNTPTQAHIHTGAPGANGSVAIPFATLVSPITGSVTLTPEQADNLLNNRMYVNIHSAAFTGGEIRGNISKR